MFVKFYDDAGKPVYVNPKSVESFSTRDLRGGGTIIRSHRTDVYVSESPNEVAVVFERYLRREASDSTLTWSLFMPVRFTDALVLSFGAHAFRPRSSDESMDEYRQAYAAHVLKTYDDPIEAAEISSGKPWDEWSEEDIKDFVSKFGDKYSYRNPLVFTWCLKYGIPRQEKRDENEK